MNTPDNSQKERKRPKQDDRPLRWGWAPGKYLNECRICECQFIGDKRATQCADCAYGMADPRPGLEPTPPATLPDLERLEELYRSAPGCNPSITGPLYNPRNIEFFEGAYNTFPALLAHIRELEEWKENEQARSIHTCHAECQRPECVLRRERDDLRAQLTTTQAEARRLREALIQMPCKECCGVGKVRVDGFILGPCPFCSKRDAALTANPQPPDAARRRETSFGKSGGPSTASGDVAPSGD